MKRLPYLLLVGLLTLGCACTPAERSTATPPASTPSHPDEDGEDDTPDTDPSDEARTLVVYYSFTNNTHALVSDLQTQIEADVIRVEPAEKGLDYAANNYAIGSALIQAIRNRPDDPASYPAIDPVTVSFDCYDTVIVAAPLWWSNMAAPLQTFLFQHGSEMAGKRIGLIVSSASSGIGGVEADARRLIPDGNFLTPSLWIRSAQTADCHDMIAEWLRSIGY